MSLYMCMKETKKQRKKIVGERISCDIFDVFLIYVFVR